MKLSYILFLSFLLIPFHAHAMDSDGDYDSPGGLPGAYTTPSSGK